MRKNFKRHPKKLTIVRLQKNNKVICQIIDNGIGVDNKKVRKFFEPYYTTKDKGTGLALGSECVKYIKYYSQKKKYKCLKKDSSWFIKSNKQLDQIFQHQYIKTIIKALKEDDITDKKILKEWHEERTKKIESKKSNLIV